MSTKKKKSKAKRNIGANMKPRTAQNQSVSEAAAPEMSEPMSAVEGQESPETRGFEAPSAVPEGADLGGGLEGEVVQNLELDGKQPEAASVASSEPVPAAPEGEGGLEDLLRQSAEAENGLKQMTEAEVDEALRAKHPLMRRSEDGEVTVVPEGLGAQPDNSYRAVVTIPEGYLSAVQEWAEAESATVEEWLDKQFQVLMESYGMPAKGR